LPPTAEVLFSPRLSLLGSSPTSQIQMNVRSHKSVPIVCPVGDGSFFLVVSFLLALVLFPRGSDLLRLCPPLVGLYGVSFLSLLACSLSPGGQDSFARVFFSTFY